MDELFFLNKPDGGLLITRVFKARRADLLVECFIFLILKFFRNGLNKKGRPDGALKIS